MAPSIGLRAKGAKKVSSKPTIAVGRSSVTQGRITRVVHNDTSGTRLHLGELYEKDSLAERESVEFGEKTKRYQYDVALLSLNSPKSSPFVLLLRDIA